jgi:hypothetical protein
MIGHETSRRLSLRFSRGLAALALPALIVVIGTAAAVAVPAQAVAVPAASDAFLRTAHLSPDTPKVDLYVSSSAAKAPTVISGVGYGTFSAYTRVPAGTYTVAARLSGTPATGAPVVSWQLQLGAGQAYTAAIIGSGTDRRGTTLQDDLTPANNGQARVRLIQAASNATSATVVANGSTSVAQNAPFASATQYVALPAGSWRLSATAAGGKPTTTKVISLAPDSVDSIILLDTASGGLRLISTLDSAGSGVMPAAGVNTGGGGLATSTNSSMPWTATAAAVAFVLGCAVLAMAGLARRRTALRS